MPEDAIQIVPAQPEDLDEILRIQRLAFQEQVDIYDAPEMPPMVETLEDMERDLGACSFLKAVAPDGRIVGSVRSRRDGDTCHVARLAVHPDWQNRGLGTRLLLAAEACHADASRYELLTGHRSDKNLHIYRKHGYRIFRRESVSDTTDLVYMEKPGRKGT